MIFFMRTDLMDLNIKKGKEKGKNPYGHRNQGTEGSLAAFVQSTEFLGFVFECSENIDIDLS